MNTTQKTALVCGAGGFIGSHLVRRLKDDGFQVTGVDLKHPEFWPTRADRFLIGDLRDPAFAHEAVSRPYAEVYQLAADMGGVGYIGTGKNDADVMRNSGLINLNVVEACRVALVGRVFYSSSACVYPIFNQRDPDNPNCAEESAYPAEPDSDYGWEKLFSERLYTAYGRNHGLICRIARFHNIFGPYGTWTGGREKAPAAMCRKVCEVENGGSIDIWGDGRQTRSFLFIDECIEGMLRLMRSDVEQPVNIGSDQMVTINELAEIAIALSGKSLSIRHIDGPTGVRGRNSDNRLIGRSLDWEPCPDLASGMKTTFEWVRTEYAKTCAT